MKKAVLSILILCFVFISCGKKTEKVKYAPSKVDRYMENCNEIRAVEKELDNLPWKNEDVSDRYNKLRDRVEYLEKKSADLLSQMSREEKEEVNARIDDLDY
ncbi:MAG: hypothetical protein K6B17_07190 [Treponema sp.]|nr:hypothetical protein [Treponema sp.]